MSEIAGSLQASHQWACRWDHSPILVLNQFDWDSSVSADRRTRVIERATERWRTGVVSVHKVPATFKDHRLDFELNFITQLHLYSLVSGALLDSWRLRCLSFYRLCGYCVRAEVVGDVTEESLLVTNRTRGTLCGFAETPPPALCGSRCEGQNT